MKYNVVRTDTADAGLRKIVLYIAQNFGNDVALKKLDEIECIDISGLEEDAEVHLKNGDEIEVKEIIDILEKRKNSKADKEFEEELDNCLLRNVKGYTIS